MWGLLWIGFDLIQVLTLSTSVNLTNLFEPASLFVFSSLFYKIKITVNTLTSWGVVWISGNWRPKVSIRLPFYYEQHYYYSYNINFFPVVMYRCESWTIKKAECQRTDIFELWCWRRLLRVPWIARRWNQPILKKSTLNIHWKGWSWSWSINTSATWCKEPTHWKWLWCWERLRAGGEGDDRGWDGWMASLTQCKWVGKLQKMEKDREA